MGKTGSKEVRTGQHQSPGWGQGGQDTNKACYCCWFNHLLGCRCGGNGACAVGMVFFAGLVPPPLPLRPEGCQMVTPQPVRALKMEVGAAAGSFQVNRIPFPGCYLRGQGAVLPSSGTGGVPLTRSSRRQSVVWLPR